MPPKKGPAGERERKAAVCIQRHWRGRQARLQYPKLLKRHRKKIFITMELLQSERTYCQNLEFVVKKVLGPSGVLIADEQLRGALFSNIEHIWKLHSHFLEQLEPVMKDFNPNHTRLSGVLLDHLFDRDNFK